MRAYSFALIAAGVKIAPKDFAAAAACAANVLLYVQDAEYIAQSVPMPFVMIATCAQNAQPFARIAKAFALNAHRTFATHARSAMIA